MGVGPVGEAAMPMGRGWRRDLQQREERELSEENVGEFDDRQHAVAVRVGRGADSLEIVPQLLTRRARKRRPLAWGRSLPPTTMLALMCQASQVAAAV